jgi:hypothetical protein
MATVASAVLTMTMAQISKPGGDFESSSAKNSYECTGLRL